MTRAMTASNLEILTVGHSNHSVEHFQGLLEANDVEVLVDIRSWPHSRYVGWADADTLPDVARSVGVKYLFLGAELGGRPEGPELYDAEGHVLYGKVAETSPFREGIDRLCRGAERCRLAIMCSEEDPTHCHRRLLVSKVLLEKGIAIAHIRGTGRHETEPGPIDLCAGTLFEDEEILWKSSLSVLRARRPRTSSAA